MTEKIVTFGSAEQVGILSLPKDEGHVHRPAVLMWNVGLNHRVGPFRFYVDLARKLADSGFVAFRFDASGLGDSGVRRQAVSDTEREELDVADAMDAVTRRTGIGSFVLVGFCSSVDAAHRVSVKDPRVVSVIHLEGYAFETKGSRRRRILRWVSRRRWERRAWIAFPWLFPRLGGAPKLYSEAVYKRDYPEWTKFSHELALITQRGTSLLFVYAGGDTFFNYEGQFWEMFGVRGIDRRKITVVYYAQADHTFSDVTIRDAISARMLRYLLELQSPPCGAARRPVELNAQMSERSKNSTTVCK